MIKFLFICRSIDANNKFGNQNEENISDDMLLHTFFTDDERVHNKKRKLRNAR